MITDMTAPTAADERREAVLQRRRDRLNQAMLRIFASSFKTAKEFTRLHDEQLVRAYAAELARVKRRLDLSSDEIDLLAAVARCRILGAEMTQRMRRDICDGLRLYPCVTTLPLTGLDEIDLIWGGRHAA